MQMNDMTCYLVSVYAVMKKCCNRVNGSICKKGKMEKNSKEQKDNFVYMVCCADGSLYTGWTNDLERRVRMHNAGKGAKYTKSRLPVKLVYHEKYEDRIQAMKREAAIKKLTRRDKLKLIEEHEQNRY